MHIDGAQLRPRPSFRAGSGGANKRGPVARELVMRTARSRHSKGIE